MNIQTQWLAKLALAVAWPAMILAVVGCDKEENQGDRKVQENLDKAQVILGATDPQVEGQLRGSMTTRPQADSARDQAAVAFIKQAMGETKASKASRVTAVAMLAQSGYGRAARQLPQIIEKEEQARRKLADIGTLADEITANNLAVAALRAGDPNAAAATTRSAKSESPQALAKQLRAQMQKDAEEFDRVIGLARGKIEEQTKVAADLQQRLKAANTEAAELGLAAEAAKDRKAGDELFGKSAQAKAQAATLARDLQKVQDELNDETGELKLRLRQAEAGKKGAEESMAAFDNSLASMGLEWSAAQEQMKKLQAESKVVADAKIAPLARDYERLLGEAEAIRKQAIADYGDAITNFSSAEDLSKDLLKDIDAHLSDLSAASSSAKAAWEQMQKVYQSPEYRVRRAMALMGRAEVYLDLAGVYLSQKQSGDALAPIFKEAGLTLPKALAADAAKGQEATNKAQEDLDNPASPAVETAEKIMAGYAPTGGDDSGTSRLEDTGIRMSVRLAGVQAKWDMYRLAQLRAGLATSDAIRQQQVKAADGYLKSAQDRLKKLADARLAGSASDSEKSFALPKFAEELDTVLEPFRRGQAPAGATPPEPVTAAPPAGRGARGARGATTQQTPRGRGGRGTGATTAPAPTPPVLPPLPGGPET